MSLQTASKQEEEDENAEADADMEEGKLAWAGGRKEAATYDAGEAEDIAFQNAGQAAAGAAEQVAPASDLTRPPGTTCN